MNSDMMDEEEERKNTDPDNQSGTEEPDYESDFGDGDDSFDEFTKVEKGSLAELWRDNPAIRVGAIALGAVFILGTIILFGGQEEPLQQSRVQGGSEVSAPPGTEGASEAYRQAVEDENEARVEEAEQSGGSALPTPVDPPVGRVTLPPEDEEEEDPLQRWRRLQEERLERELEVRETVEPEPVVEDNTQAQEVQALADNLLGQMQSILDNQSIPEARYVGMTPPQWLEQKREQEQAEQETIEDELEQEAEEARAEVMQPAGEIEYAQLMTEANSDTPGPVLAYIASGPLRGGRLIGSFEVQGDYLTLKFETAVFEQVSYAANAVAVDPDTTLPGMATEVDHRYFQRVVLPAAAAFVEGMAEAVSESGTTNITITGETVTESNSDKDNEQEVASGISELGSELGDLFDDIADDTETLVRIEKGTPMGVLFLEPVVKQPK